MGKPVIIFDNGFSCLSVLDCVHCVRNKFKINLKSEINFHILKVDLVL